MVTAIDATGVSFGRASIDPAVALTSAVDYASSFGNSAKVVVSANHDLVIYEVEVLYAEKNEDGFYPVVVKRHR